MPTKNQIRYVHSLKQKKCRLEHGEFVVEGEKMVRELNESNWEVIASYHTSKNPHPVSGSEEVSDKDMERMSFLKSSSPALAVVKQRTWQPGNWKGRSVLLDDIKDPGNLGTIIRTCDWFGVDRIICSNETVDMYNPKVIQSSMGSMFRMPVVYRSLSGAIDELKKNEIPVLGTVLGGTNIFETSSLSEAAWIIGSESHGMSGEIQDRCDALVSIPGFGQAESLNAGIALASFLAVNRYKEHTLNTKKPL